MAVNLLFSGGAYKGRASAQNAQICINWYPETDKYDTAKRSLVGTPGTVEWLDLDATGPLRGFHEYRNELYVVNGDKFNKIDSNKTVTELGTLDSNTGRVSISDNYRGQEIAIADSEDLYIYDEVADTFVKNTDPSFNSASIVSFMDGYLIWNETNTDIFQISNLNDATAIFGEAVVQGAAGELISLYVDHRELWLFKKYNTEVYYNDGDPDFPFTRFQGGFNHNGCAAKFSPQRIDKTIMWLACNDRGRGQIVRAREGFRTEVATPTQITYQIAQMDRIDDAFAFVYQEENHEFYQITFPSEDVTYVYDAAENEWHQRSSQTGSAKEGKNPKRHIADHYAFVYGKHLVGSYKDDIIYEMSSSIYDDAGNPIIRERIGPHIRDDMDEVSFSEVEFLFEPGVATATTTAPKAELRSSVDRGHTWGPWQDREVGGVGKYRTRAIWRKQGSFRDKLYHLRVSDPVQWVLVDAYGK